MRDFTDRYPELGLPYEQIEQAGGRSPVGLLKDFFGRFRTNARHGERIFAIIDEYDHFANAILAKDKEAFRQITSTAADHEGLIKQIYACLKQFYAGNRRKPIDRFFITGVSAVSLDSLVSGFNIATNISTDPEFGAMAGFTHDELSRLVDETVDFSALSPLAKKDLMWVMEKHYDGYAFSSDGRERVFNSNMCVAFLYDVVRNGKLPDIMPGSAGDDLAGLDGLLRLSDEKAQEIICDMIFRRGDITTVGEPGELNLNHAESFDFAQAVWMLYYLGYLTMCESPGSTKYRCPNETAYQAFADYLAVKMGFGAASSRDVSRILRNGDAGGLAREAEKCIAELPDSAFSGFNERSLQLCFHYIIKWRAEKKAESIPEADTGEHGRVDLLVINKTGGPDLMLEFKYISKSRADDARVARALGEARSQLERYKAAPRFKDNGRLKAYAMVFVGPKAVKVEEV